jgi:hypothetical protein
MSSEKNWKKTVGRARAMGKSWKQKGKEGAPGSGGYIPQTQRNTPDITPQTVKDKKKFPGKIRNPRVPKKFKR